MFSGNGKYMMNTILQKISAKIFRRAVQHNCNDEFYVSHSRKIWLMIYRRVAIWLYIRFFARIFSFEKKFSFVRC